MGKFVARGGGSEEICQTLWLGVIPRGNARHLFLDILLAWTLNFDQRQRPLGRTERPPFFFGHPARLDSLSFDQRQRPPGRTERSPFCFGPPARLDLNFDQRQRPPGRTERPPFCFGHLAHLDSNFLPETKASGQDGTPASCFWTSCSPGL